MLAVSILGIVAFHVSGLQEWAKSLLEGWLGKNRYAEFTFSKFFLTDYLLAFFVAMNFVAMRRIAPALGWMWAAIEKPVRLTAAYTFTLYLLHQPLFLFWGSVLRWSPEGHSFWWAVTVLTGASVWAVGQLTETRRHGLRAWILARLLSIGLDTKSTRGIGNGN
jgi:peptidoglycan/LPS O-acetylase OafA/YrhL